MAKVKPVMVQMINRLWWKTYCLWLACQWAFQVNLGDKVWYKGKKYIVANGVIQNQWRLSNMPDDKQDWVQNGLRTLRAS